MTTPAPASRRAAAVPLALLLTLALQSAVPPFATDTYTPAFPQVTRDLGTSAGLVGLTLTTFFIGLGVGQLLGGPLSDQLGRRWPLITGGLLCMVAAAGCAVAPSIAVLIAFRVVQGLGGGLAAVVARSVVADRASGHELARVLSLLMALGGLAPMVAPVLGGAVLTAGGTWRTVFWVLVGLGAVMVATAFLVVGESLPVDQRRGGGMGRLAADLGGVVRNRTFMAFALAAALSQLTMMAYVANAAYVLEAQKGMAPMPYSLFFASTALAQVLLSVVNARIVGRQDPRRLVLVGLAMSVVSVCAIAAAVFALGTPLVLTCAGFLVLMAAQAFIMGNTSAMATAAAPEVVGAASAVLGVLTAIALAASAPLASSGGARTAAPMVWVMLVGVVGSVAAFLTADRRPATGRPQSPKDQTEASAPSVVA